MIRSELESVVATMSCGNMIEYADKLGLPGDQVKVQCMFLWNMYALRFLEVI